MGRNMEVNALYLGGVKALGSSQIMSVAHRLSTSRLGKVLLMYILLYRLTNCLKFSSFFVQRMNMSIEYALFYFRLQSTFLCNRDAYTYT